MAKAGWWYLRGWTREERESSHVVVRRDSVSVGIVRCPLFGLIVVRSRGAASVVVNGWRLSFRAVL